MTKADSTSTTVDFRITTTTMDDGSFVNECTTNDHYECDWDHERVLWRHVIQTRDDQIRKALVALGWTPPPDDKGE